MSDPADVQDVDVPPVASVVAPGRGLELVVGAIVAAVVGTGLAVAAGIGAAPLLVVTAVIQAVLIVSWVLGTGLPGRIGAVVIGALAAAGADTVVSVWPHGQLGTLLPVMALALPVMFVHQLTRGVVRVRVVESLADIALLVVVTVAFAAYLQLRHEVDGRAMVVTVLAVTGAALVAGFLVDLAWSHPRFDPEVPRGLLAVVVSVAVGALVGWLRMHGTIEFNAGRAALLGASVGAIAALFAMGLEFVQHTSSLPATMRRLRPVFGVVVVFGLSGPASYLLCLAIRG